LILNKKYEELFSSKARYYIITGGRGSGKSFAVTVFLTLLTMTEGIRVLFTRFTMVSAHLSIIPEFLEKIILLGYENTFSVNKAEVVNLKNKSDILFRGIKTSAGNQTASLKSLQGVSTWVLDEAEELIDEDIFDTIDLSIREKNIQNRIIGYIKGFLKTKELKLDIMVLKTMYAISIVHTRTTEKTSQKAS